MNLTVIGEVLHLSPPMLPSTLPFATANGINSIDRSTSDRAAIKVSAGVRKARVKHRERRGSGSTPAGRVVPQWSERASDDPGRLLPARPLI